MVFLAAATLVDLDLEAMTCFKPNQCKLAEKLFEGDVPLEVHQQLVKEGFKSTRIGSHKTRYELRC